MTSDAAIQAFVPAGPLYRQAVAARARARARADDYAKTGKLERYLRERDAAVTAVMMTQAAAESWINWAYVWLEVIPPGGGWVKRWEQAVIDLPTARGAAGRPLNEETTRFLRQLSAWRNFLAHGDASSRARLATY